MSRRIIATIIMALLVGGSPSVLASPPSLETRAASATTVTVYSQVTDGEVMRIDCNDWNTCRSSSSGTYAWSNLTNGTVQAAYYNSTYHVKRAFFYFDTSAIPSNARIVSAVLNVYAANYLQGSTSVHVVRSTANTPLSVADFSRVQFVSGGSASRTTVGWMNITLNATALDWIAKGGTTRLALIHNLDLNNSAPNTINSLLIAFAEDSQYRPSLVVTFESNPTYSVSGRVTDASGQGISGVTISAGAGGSAITASNGTYTITGLAAGTYTLTPSKPGHTFFPRTVSVPPDALDANFAPWDCGLAGIPQYYQGWPSTPDSLPNKPTWYAKAYGNPLNYPDTDTVNTIGKWGCNLSCASMVTSYFGRNALTPFETDPGKLNAWLRMTEHLGYDKDNGAIYAKVADYAWANGVSLFLNGIGGRNDQKLDQHLCSGNPAMIQVATSYGSHYVLATGKTVLDGQTTYTINDPIWGQTTLRDHYNDDYQAAYYYRRGPGIYRTSMMQFSMHSPVHLLVTDPLGRKSGYDPRTGTSWNEIPNAGYVTETITAPDGTSLPELKVFVASQPIGGQYGLDVIGYADGAYTIDAFLTDLAGNTRFDSFGGMATPGSVDHLPVNYVPSRTYLPMIRASN